MPPLTPRSALRYAVALLLSCTALWFAVLFSEAGRPMLSLPFFAAVIATLWIGGPGPALAATGASILSLGYLLARASLGRPWLNLASAAQVIVFAFICVFLIRRTATLEGTKKLLFTTLSGLGDAVIATDRRGIVVFASRLAEELAGTALTREPLRRVWPELTERGRTHLALPAGRTFDLLTSHLPGYGQLYVLHEVTEHKKTEELRLLLERLVGSMREGFHVVDIETGEVLLANRAIHEITGYGPGELVGKNISIINAGNPAEQIATAQKITDALKNQGFWQGELHNRRKDGSEILTQLAVTLYEQGGRLYASSLQTDITARRESEQALRRSEQRFRSLMESMRDIVFTLDTLQRFTGVYGVSSERYGLDPGRSLGRSARELFGMERAAAHEEANGRALAGENVDYEWSLDTGSGTVYVQTSLSPLREPDGSVSGVVGVARDVTLHKQLEQRLRDAQKIEAIGRLAGGVAHDFNNLMTVITGYSQMMVDEFDSKEPAHKYAAAILKAGNRASMLTSQLLAFSGRQIIQPEVLDMNDVVAKVTPLLHRFLGDSAVLTTKLASNLARVRVDPAQLEHIIMSLAANARDAMPSGGVLTIETSNTELESSPAEGVPPGPHVVLSVKDTGAGMTAEVMAHLFEPFFTTKGVGKGTGLGLSSVHGIARQNRGHVSVESEPGRGTTVRVFLPQTNPAPEAEVAISAMRHGGTETILVVENEPAVRALTGQLLRKQGYQVIETGSGPEALEWGADRKQRIDLLLTDIITPLMSGPELATRFAGLRPEVRVLYMSAYSDEAIQSAGVSPAVPYIHKPFTATELARHVREVLSADL